MLLAGSGERGEGAGGETQSKSRSLWVELVGAGGEGQMGLLLWLLFLLWLVVEGSVRGLGVGREWEGHTTSFPFSSTFSAFSTSPAECV